jgi:hypothetical protein
MSLAESNIYRISELTESLYRNYESGASWVCEARTTVDGSVCGVLNDLDVCTLCSSKRDRADDVTSLLNSSVDDETTHSNFPLLGKRKEINNSEQSDKSSET